MDTTIIFEVEKYLSIIVTALAFGAFFFTLRHRKYYSCWARSAILLGALIEFYSSYNCFLCYHDLQTMAMMAVDQHGQPHMIQAVIHIGYSLTISTFIYTILRFRWSIRKQYKTIMKELKQHK
tara:strand:+ start:266 stop:634 length:369 start_codon:yes stop_codon:yes gene_type:complete